MANANQSRKMLSYFLRRRLRKLFHSSRRTRFLRHQSRASQKGSRNLDNPQLFLFSSPQHRGKKKGFGVLNLIKRTFPKISRTDFQLLYGVYVRPLLEYASQVTASGRTKDVLVIERVQRAATRLVQEIRHFS